MFAASTKPTVVSGSRPIVRTTAAGPVEHPADAVGRTVIPPCSANTVTIAKPPTLEIGATAAAVDIPTHFNWLTISDAQKRIKELHGDKRMLPWYALDPPNQLQCGSCWSFSSTGALGDRLRIATNVELPPLSVTYTLACGNIGQVQAGGGPCLGGQIAYGAALAMTKGIPGWLAADYAPFSKAGAEQLQFSDIGPVGRCLASQGVIIGITEDSEETEKQKLEQQAATNTIEADMKAIAAADPPKDLAPPGTPSYEYSGLPAAATLTAKGGAGQLAHATPGVFTLLQDFGAVREAVYLRGPVMAQYFVPGDFVTGWPKQHLAWAETQHVYVHSLELDLYGNDPSDLATARSSASSYFTNDPKNVIRALCPPDCGEVTAEADCRLPGCQWSGGKCQCTAAAWPDGTCKAGGAAGQCQTYKRALCPPGVCRFDQTCKCNGLRAQDVLRHQYLCVGGHAVVIVGYAVVDLWTPLDGDAAKTTYRIRPFAGTPYREKYGGGCVAYKVRNSWAATGPAVDGKQGLWLMLAGGEYEVLAPGQAQAHGAATTTLTAPGTCQALSLNTMPGFDVPVMVGGTAQTDGTSFGGVAEVLPDVSKVGAAITLAKSMDKLERLQRAAAKAAAADPDDGPQCACGAAVQAVAPLDPAAPPVPTRFMTPAGWIFFALAMTLLIIALVMACIATGKRRRQSFGWLG
jgi:hypothetical protein